MIDGDIIAGRVTDRKRVRGDRVLPKPIRLWTGKEIPYEIEPGFPEAHRVLGAIRHFNAVSPIQLVPRELAPNASDGIRFIEHPDKCASFLGAQGEWQDIWLAEGCNSGTVVHEIFHALGMIHEQQRADRDRYVKVIWEDILPDKRPQFEMVVPPRKDLTAAMPFDYRSIMIYDRYSFGRAAGVLTLVSKTDQPILPSYWPTRGDIRRLRALYGP